MQLFKYSFRRLLSQITLFTVILLLLVVIVMVNSSVSGQATQPSATQPANDTSQITSSPGTITPSPTPERMTNDPNEANGIIFGGVLMVMIVVIGTLSVIRKKSKSEQK